MTKMAAMPLYGKNTLKVFFSGISGPISTKLVMKHWDSSLLYFVQMITVIKVDLDLFYGMVKFSNLVFYIYGKL